MTPGIIQLKRKKEKKKKEVKKKEKKKKEEKKIIIKRLQSLSLSLSFFF
jgi:hypothetical protein